MENLRLKPREAELAVPGISILKAATPGEVVHQVKEAFPNAHGLHELAKVIGTTTEERIRGAGFDIIPNPSKKLPNHFRLIHPQGVVGFNDENLALLAQAFTNTTGAQ